MSEDESQSDYIHFLGTAGARFAMAKQIRSSAGTFLRLCGKNIMLDAGPGTLVRCASVIPQIDVFKLDAIILTHTHIDHSTDVNCLIDAMTGGGIWKRGTLFTPRECLEGDSTVVLRYLRGFLDEIVPLEASSMYGLDGVVFGTSLPHRHGVENYGIKFKLKQCNLSFLIDTKFFPELIDEYMGTDLLVVNVVRHRPDDAPHALHLCMDEVKEIVAAVKPRKTIITHFGMTLLHNDPAEIARVASDEVGHEIVAAMDGMIVAL
jgi:ribonuclease BN (tRNA processing enzyme)